MNQRRRKSNIELVLYSLLVIAAIGFAISCGFLLGRSTIFDEVPYSDFDSNQVLHIAVKNDPNAGFTNIQAEELGGSYNDGITYLNVSDVSIEVNGEYMELVQAVRDGYITIEEIIAQAQIDARNDICSMQYESELGLSRFVYGYQDYELLVTYDVFEAPDDEQYLIRDFMITNVGGHKSISHTLYITDEEGNIVNLRREDWGITLQASSATPTDITILCTQSGGQHMGELKVSYFGLLNSNRAPIDSLIEWSEYEFSPIIIPQETTSQLCIDWTARYGELPSGTYYLALEIEDIYDETNDLVKNYSDVQNYYVEFIIQ